MYECPFCNSNNCTEVKMIPRSCKEYMDDKDIQVMKDKYLFEMKCKSCNNTFTIDKDLYRNKI